MPNGRQSAQPRATYWGCILYEDNEEQMLFKRYIEEHANTIEYWMIRHEPDVIWKCQCGNECHGRFCPMCGRQIPEENKPKKQEIKKQQTWKCECGHTNPEGYKFCEMCGEKKQEQQEQPQGETKQEEQEQQEEKTSSTKYHWHVMIKMKAQTARNGFIKWTGGVISYAKPIDSPEGNILYFMHETPASQSKKQYPAENIKTNNRKLVDKATLGRLHIYQHLYLLSEMVTGEGMTLNEVVKEVSQRAYEQENGAESLAETMLRYQNLVIAMAQETRAAKYRKEVKTNDSNGIQSNDKEVDNR